MSDSGNLARLCELAGLVTSFRDALGNPCRASEDVQRSVLAAMRMAAETDKDVAASIRTLEDAPWQQPLPPVIVTGAAKGGGLRVPLVLPHSFLGKSVGWRFEKETGRPVEGTSSFADLPLIDQRMLNGQLHDRRHLDLPCTVRPGYHRLRLFHSGSGESATGSNPREIQVPIIAAPRRCHGLPGPDRRIWGIAAQLYGLQSSRNWGIGDFGDLGDFVRVAKRLGADAVGLNPVHAMFPDDPTRISPYSPSDRRFLNSLYIDVESVPEFAECEAARALASEPAFLGRLHAARGARLVDYANVMDLKRRTLELLFGTFRDRHLGADSTSAIDERGTAFRRFQSNGGTALEHFAVFQALAEHFGKDTPWWNWPPAYRNPASMAVAEFARTHQGKVDFFKYVQWQADEQLRLARHKADDAGMAIGLYHDLPLAADANGAEAWSNQHLLAAGIQIGAPPDEWNQRGQNWGLPAYCPVALRQAAYAPVVAAFRASMTYGGALRIDHVMGLERLYWIPQGHAPHEGCYVRYPREDLLHILALESIRHKCMIVGEDLGTVPDGLRDRLRTAGVLSYRVLYFAQDEKAEILRPASFPSQALVAVNTHDLATFPGFWHGHDLDLRARLDLYPSSDMEAKARSERVRERQAMIRAFKCEGLLSDDFPDDDALSPEVVLAAHRYLARSPARLLLAHLEDALGEEDQVNLPGTVDEHPNWRRRMSLTIDRIESDPRIVALATAIGEERRYRRERHRKSGPAPA